MLKEIPHIVCVCSATIIKSVGNNYKIRSKVIVIKGDQAFAVCKSCNQEVEIPIKFDAKSLNPPLIIIR